jgi:hypothetical protein
VGSLLLVLGLVLAVIAFTALSHPHGRRAGLLAPLASAPAVVPGTAAAAQHPIASPSPVGGVTGNGVTGNGTAGNGTAGNGMAPGAGSGSPATIPVIVLDNTGRPALARGATALLEQAGWSVTDTSTFDGDILSTAAYYDPATAGAQAAAEALQVQFPEIQRVRPRFDGLPQGPIVVVLTYDYSRAKTTS